MPTDPSNDLPPEFSDAESETWAAELPRRSARRKHLIRWLVVGAMVTYLAMAVVMEKFGH